MWCASMTHILLFPEDRVLKFPFLDTLNGNTGLPSLIRGPQMTVEVIWTGGGPAAIDILPEQMNRYAICSSVIMATHYTYCEDHLKCKMGNKYTCSLLKRSLVIIACFTNFMIFIHWFFCTWIARNVLNVSVQIRIDFSYFPIF